MDITVTPEKESVPERTSDILARLAQDDNNPGTTIGALLDALKDRGFGVVLILFSFPNAILPIAWILGTPILFFAVQLVIGLEEPWLPDALRRPGVGRETFHRLMAYAIKYLRIIEQWLKPRWTWLTGRTMERIIGVYMVFLTLVLLVPIVPFGNALPAFGIGIIAAGLMERDGLAIVIGSAIGAAGAVYVLAVIGGAFAATKAIFGF
jgi:hypothetical protein